VQDVRSLHHQVDGEGLPQVLVDARCMDRRRRDGHQGKRPGLSFVGGRMNLPTDISRCQGEYRDHWLRKSEPCARRNECARHAVIPFDVLRGDPTSMMQHCVDDGRLTAFLPISEAMKEDE
jgi:hypothetical protein